MDSKVNVENTWKSTKEIKFFKNSQWKSPLEVKVYHNGQWNTFWKSDSENK